ncbi:MAG: DUF692 domain-containing protein [Calditrichia bacterium]|nr:DUF692 domain-containing protein [Calditrichia bacterium]
MVQGVGLGFRRDLADDLLKLDYNKPAFVEFAPENWINMGGFWGKQMKAVAEKYPILCHGLSLSIGSPEELDWEFLKQLKKFFKEVPALIYSEHLSFSKCDNAHLFDLLPIPFREDAVKHTVERIKIIQDFLERPLAIENVSYYTPVGAQMDEAEFISSIVKESGCNMLLDVNNVYVNAFNHNYNAKQFIRNLPLDKVVYIHMAGHEKVSDDLIIDTHGQPIIDPVYDLFSWTVERLNPVPVLLERDFNIPKLSELQQEMSQLQNIINNKWEEKNVAA